MTLRRATLKDAGAIARIHVQSWRETYAGLMPPDFLDAMTTPVKQRSREQEWRAGLSAGQHNVWVAQVHGEVVGFTSGGPARTPPYDAELLTLYVLARAQGQGLGRQLVHALAGDLAVAGHRSLLLWVLSGNPSALFYAHLGGAAQLSKTQTVPGGDLSEVGYVWDDLRVLAASAQ